MIVRLRRETSTSSRQYLALFREGDERFDRLLGQVSSPTIAIEEVSHFKTTITSIGKECALSAEDRLVALELPSFTLDCEIRVFAGVEKEQIGCRGPAGSRGLDDGIGLGTRLQPFRRGCSSVIGLGTESALWAKYRLMTLEPPPPTPDL